MESRLPTISQTGGRSLDGDVGRVPRNCCRPAFLVDSKTKITRVAVGTAFRTSSERKDTTTNLMFAVSNLQAYEAK